MAEDKGYLGEIIEIKAKTGVYGEIYQCLVKVLEGNDTGRVILRNIKGPVFKNMYIVLKETEREAREIRGR